MSDYPRTLLEFQHLFPNEAACARHLERIRWPEGFECPSCRQVGDPWRLQARPRVLECRQCGYQVSLTAGTVMHRTRQSLPIWFWAAYLVTTQTTGMSALQFQRQLGIKRYETAFLMLHKLRAAMIRPERDRIESVLSGQSRLTRRSLVEQHKEKDEVSITKRLLLVW